ncbi:MAG: DUF1735 domain-containing protein [Bacteroidales bacterium]
MKTINKFFPLVCLIVTALTSTSCLKDDNFIEWDKMGVVIELPYVNHYITQTKVLPTKDISFDFLVNYTVPYAEDNQQDISVSLAVAPDMVKTYNQSLGSTGTYILLPESAYTLPSPVIPKGKRLYEAPFTIKTSDLQPGEKYLLPIKIAGVPAGYTISGNFGHVYLRIHMK